MTRGPQATSQGGSNASYAIAAVATIAGLALIANNNSKTYDPLLLAACTAQWQAPGHVVGTAMAHCDGPNLLGDGFFSERLGFLIDAGRVEADNDQWLRIKSC